MSCAGVLAWRCERARLRRAPIICLCAVLFRTRFFAFFLCGVWRAGLLVAGCWLRALFMCSLFSSSVVTYMSYIIHVTCHIFYVCHIYFIKGGWAGCLAEAPGGPGPGKECMQK